MDAQQEHGWSNEDETWRRKARDFATRQLAPVARGADRVGRMSPEVVPGLGAAGLIGALLAREGGGGGASAVASCLMAEEIGAVDGSVRGFLAVQAGLVATPLLAFGSEAQRRAWLPLLLTGKAIGAFALTEPGAGSDIGAVATTAREDKGDVVLDGEKVWITNGGIAEVLLVFATADKALKTKGLECYLVPAGSKGLTREPMPGHPLGHRSSDHARLVLDGVRVPKGSRLGGAKQGFDVAMAGLEVGRLHVAAGAVGILRACRDACVSFAGSRRQFGQRIGDFQQVGAAIADMEVAFRAAKLLTLHAARLRDRGTPSPEAVSVAKLHATEAALSAATTAIQIHGSRAYTDELPIERHWRDAIALTIYEGTSHIQRVILSRALLGKDEPR